MAVSDFMKPGRHMKQRVKILTVDPATRRVEAVLKDGTAIQIAVWEISPLFRWPKEEEHWSVWKENGYWMLDSPMEDKRFQDKPVEDLNAGDVRVNAPNDAHVTASGDIHLKGSEIQTIGKIVANTGVQIPTGAGVKKLLASDASGNGAWEALAISHFPSAVIDALLPWSIDIDPFLTPVTQTTWSTQTVDASAIHNAWLESSATVGSIIGWDVILAAGTWTFTLLYTKGSTAGIYNVKLDTVSQGTIDGYNAATTRNQLTTIAGIVVATSAKKRLTLEILTKNASSTNFKGAIQAVGLRRTA